MLVWSVQPLVVWERLQELTVLTVDPAYYHEGYVPWQYEWMAQQMHQRIPGNRGGLPWWSYCEKPDLRWVRHRRPGGQPQVRIELTVNASLSFPRWAWNVVHAGQFLSFALREQRAWTAALRRAVPDVDLWPLPEPWQSELEISWRQLFQPGLPSYGWKDVENDSTACHEAVFEELRMVDVQSVAHFVGNSRRSV